MQSLCRRSVRLGVLALAAAGTLAATAAGANPHVVSASATMADPTVVAPANITWDDSLNVPFKVAGLGNNSGITATLTAHVAVSIDQVSSPINGVNSATIDQKFTIPAGLSLTLSSSGHSVSFTATFVQTTATLTSDQNGHVTATLTIPGEVDASTTGDECVKVSWTQITLTVGTLTPVTLPDVSKQYDSSGSFCG